MTDTDRHDPPHDADPRLDAHLHALPREIEPGRDLWPGVAARLEPRAAAATSRRRGWAWQAAAGLLLVAGSSLLTATWLDRARGPGTMAAHPVTTTAPAPAADAEDVAAMPAAFGPGTRLDADYVAARRQLTSVLEARMSRLPDSTRAKLAMNLAELRRAAEEINVALAEQPGDPLLQELLLKTYQDELAVLANVNQLTNALASANEGGAPEAKRMEL